MKGMFKKYFLVLILAFASVALSAQVTTVRGEVKDVLGRIVPGVNVSLDSRTGTTTDLRGYYEIAAPAGDSVRIVFSHVGYHKVDTTIQTGKPGTVVVLHMKMVQESRGLEEVVVTEKYISLFERRDWTIIDFDVYEDRIVVLANEKRTPFLFNYNLDGRIVSKLKLDGEYEHVYKSCIGALHLVGEKTCHQISVADRVIDTFDTYPRTYFDTYIKPCVANNDLTVVHKNLTNLNKRIVYQSYSKLKQDPRIVYEVIDQDAYTVARGMLRAIVQAYYAEISSPSSNSIRAGFPSENIIEDGTWKGDLKDLIISNKLHRMVSYYLNVESKPISSDLAYVSDKYVVLDYLNKKMIELSANDLHTIRTNGIGKLRKPTLIHDDKRQKYYIMEYDINPSIRQVLVDDQALDVSDRILEPNKVFFPFKACVYNGVLYIGGQKSNVDPVPMIFKIPLNIGL